MDSVLRLQCGDYPCQFHVSPDEIHGILGMDFLERHQVNFSAADNKKLFVGNRPVSVYNHVGTCPNHRIISMETVHAPPHQRFIINEQIDSRKPGIICLYYRQSHSKNKLLMLIVVVGFW